MDFRKTSIVELASDIAQGKVSATEITQATIENICQLNPAINAFCAVDEEAALEQARAIDHKISQGHDPGALAGIPIGVTALEHARGFVIPFGSALHADAAPPPYASHLY